MKRNEIIIVIVLVLFLSGVSAQETRIEANTSIKVEQGTTLDISAGNLVLESGISGDASLIDFGNVTYSGGGEAMVQRYLTEGKWHLISSPVENEISGIFTGDYLQSHLETTNGWTDIISTNTNLTVMQGYAFWSVAGTSTTEVFTGTTNTGVINKPFTQNGLGWNLVGNPYPSTLDWDAVSIPAGLNGAFWIFDPTTGTNGDYRYYINGGGAANTTSQYIPSGQGFFVRATGGAGLLTLDNSSRVHSGQDFYKNAGKQLLVLKVTGNGFTTQTAVRFNENSTKDIDRLYDVYRIISDSPDVPMLFTKAGNEIMAINTLPSLKEYKRIPLWFRAGINGEYFITANETETFAPETPVYLQDLETGQMQNLKENPKYVFNYKSGTDRNFIIHFSVPESNTTTGEIKIFAHNNMLNVRFPSSSFSNHWFKAKIMVFDLTGKMILAKSTSNIENKISLPANNNIYLVKVFSNKETAIGKVFIR